MWSRLVGRFGGPFGGYRDDGSHRDGCSGVVLKCAKMWVPFAGRFGGPFGGYRDDGSHRDGCSGVVLKM